MSSQIPAVSPPRAPLPPVTTVDDVRTRLAMVRARVDAAATAAGRNPSEITVLPVTKTIPKATLRLAAAAGVSRMGENKVQEAKAKAEAMADLPIAWSLIGHLQTNKARDAAAFATELQSLDSVHLAEALDRRLQAAGRGLDVYVQVNTSGEDSKSGLAPAEVLGFLEALPTYSSLHVVGLMTIAANTDDVTRVRSCFRLLRELRDSARQAGTVGAGLLSMGMSGDLEAAVAEGSTCVRVGQAVFGARRYPQAH
ncbi:YggS family pyridoxal phosphate-dependent enzyme [Actinomyces trachealis]|uniref:YggS family pyridoxal phosphate-dependent enzyme n=1 Tax=Actinomyces trachealis TaxID=2763540 RepID=UPI0018C7499B|nr:YggS family pyridoxal phosphate-dependent enzyme [Actinomyces trachealis]